MKSRIEDNLWQINRMKQEQCQLKGDTYNDQLSEAGNAVIQKEIDAMQVDVDELAEETVRLIAKYAKS